MLSDGGAQYVVADNGGYAAGRDQVFTLEPIPCAACEQRFVLERGATCRACKVAEERDRWHRAVCLGALVWLASVGAVSNALASIGADRAYAFPISGGLILAATLVVCAVRHRLRS